MTGVPQLGTLEKRFREGKGHKYLRDGVTVRCQGVSKTNMRKFRVERGNPELESDDVWPEGQCDKAALPGAFGCIHHGGKSREQALATGKTTSLGLLPFDLQQKIEILQQNPDYINREMEIWQLLGMNAQLYERMEELGGGPDSFEKILDGVAMITGGQIQPGVEYIKKVIQSEFAQKELRDELRTNMALLGNMTKIQVSTAKELKTMATTDQVMAMVEGTVDDFIQIVKELVVDQTLANKLIDRYIRATKLRLNARIAPSAMLEETDVRTTTD